MNNLKYGNYKVVGGMNSCTCRSTVDWWLQNY